MMVNPKIICISACIGFCLSFFIGLISGVGMLYVFLRALIFAVVFAVLSVGISYLYKTFLSVDFRANPVSEGEPAAQKPVTGGVVNLVVDDSTLADDDSAPKFSVTNGRNALGGESLTAGKEPEHGSGNDAGSAAMASSPVASAPAGASETVQSSAPGFVPSNLSSLTNANVQPSIDGASGQNPAASQSSSNPSAAEAGGVAGADKVSEAPSPAADSSKDTLDELPEIGELNLSSGSSASSVISDSDFASGSSSSSSGGSGTDTNVMAQAIRTILAKDN